MASARRGNPFFNNSEFTAGTAASRYAVEKETQGAFLLVRPRAGSEQEQHGVWLARPAVNSATRPRRSPREGERPSEACARAAPGGRPRESARSDPRSQPTPGAVALLANHLLPRKTPVGGGEGDKGVRPTLGSKRRMALCPLFYIRSRIDSTERRSPRWGWLGFLCPTYYSFRVHAFEGGPHEGALSYVLRPSSRISYHAEP